MQPCQRGPRFEYVSEESGILPGHFLCPPLPSEADVRPSVLPSVSPMRIAQNCAFQIYCYCRTLIGNPKLEVEHVFQRGQQKWSKRPQYQKNLGPTSSLSRKPSDGYMVTMVTTERE